MPDQFLLERFDAQRLAPAPVRSRRDAGIDVVRLCCVFGVAVIHALPTTAPLHLWMQLAWTACLPAVPFFFIASGYFLRWPESFRNSIVLKPLARLLPVYLFWMLVYFVLVTVILRRPWPLSFSNLLWGGPAYHLWFLPALGFALSFVGAGLALVGAKLTGIACALLAAVALGRGAYHDLLHVPGGVSIHAGQFAGPLYVYIGVMLARRPVTIRWRWLLPMIVVFYAVMVGDEMLTASAPGSPPHDVLLSTFILGPILFLAARKIPNTPAIASIARIGRATLGIYAVHLAVVWLLLPYIGNENPRSVTILACLAFALAAIFSLVAQSVPGLRSVGR